MSVRPYGYRYVSRIGSGRRMEKFEENRDRILPAGIERRRRVTVVTVLTVCYVTFRWYAGVRVTDFVTSTSAYFFYERRRFRRISSPCTRHRNIVGPERVSRVRAPNENCPADGQSVNGVRCFGSLVSARAVPITACTPDVLGDGSPGI